MTAFVKNIAFGCGLLFMGMQAATAQPRYCDMANTLIDPAEGAFIAPYAHFDLRIQIKNNGPDDLMAGDTLYYNTSMDFSQSYTPYILSQNIDAGDSAEIFLMNVANNNENPANETALFCVRIKTFPQQTIRDTSTGNNSSCNSVTFGGIDPPSAVNELSTGNAVFTLYPNPAGAWLQLKIKEPAAREATIVLTDITGRRLQAFQWTAGMGTLRIPVSGLNAGIYLISLQAGGQQSFLKFVKQ